MRVAAGLVMRMGWGVSRILVLGAVASCFSAPKPYSALSVAGIDSVHALRAKLVAARTVDDRESLEFVDGYYRYLAPRAAPRDTLDRSRYLVALSHQLAMPIPDWLQRLADRSHRPPRPSGSGTWNHDALMGAWRFVGPSTIAWGGTNVSGRVNAIAVDPLDSTVVFVASALGGVWRSTDSGQSWIPLSDEWPTLAVSSVAIDPTHPSTIYAGTGDFQGGMSFGAGVMKSTDGGATWSQLGAAQFGASSIPRLVVDPDHANVVLAAASNGLWRSEDGGASWARAVTSGGATVRGDVYFDLELGAPSKTASSGRWYFAVGEVGGKATVVRSADRGATWTEMTVPQTSTNQFGLQIATSPLDGDRLYFLSAADQAVMQSRDAAASWIGDTGNLTQGAWDWNQGGYDFALACSSVLTPSGHQDVVYVGLKHIFQSTSLNGWTQIPRAHDDQHVIEIDPHDPNALMIGSDGGLHRETWTPGTNQWSTVGLNQGLGTALFYAAATASSNSAVVIGGTQDNGTIGTFGEEGARVDPSVPWRYLADGDGGAVAIDTEDERVEYSNDWVGAYGLWRTGDRWQSKREITPNADGSPNAPVVTDPSNPHLVYWGTDYLYQWDDSHSRWLPRIGNQKLASCDGCSITTIAIAPSDPFQFYVGTSDGKVWVTGFAGASWEEIETGATSLPAGMPVQSISVSPDDPNRIIVGLGGFGSDHVWRCDQATSPTRTWVDVSGAGATSLPNAQIWSVARDFRMPSQWWWVATDVGVFHSIDGGATWLDGGPTLGMPRAIVSTLEVLSTGELQAATLGRGIWRLPLRLIDLDAPDFDVVAHVDGRGDVTDHAFAWVGSKSAGKTIEGFEIDPTSTWAGLGLEVMGHLQGTGDTAWSSAGTFLGARVETGRIEGFAVRLTGAEASLYDVFYQAHLGGTGDTRVYRNGELCGASDDSHAIQALRIWIAHK